MQYRMRKILATPVAVAMVIASTLLAVGSLIGAPAPSALAAGISSVTDYPVPGSFPWGTAFDSSGRVWVALPGCDLAPTCPGSTPPGKLAVFDPKTRNWVAVVSLPAGYGQPLFVAIDYSGKVWFTMPTTNTIGMYDPVSTTVAQWAVPTPSAGPWGIATDSKGTIWFTEHYANQIGSFDPSSQTFHEIATPASNSQPYGITVDASDQIWFTENTDSVALIGEYTNGEYTDGRMLKEYNIRTTPTGGTGLTPHLITVDLHGNIWWSEGWATAIGTLSVAVAKPGTNDGVTEYPYPGSHTSGISADKQDRIWLDDSVQNTFGSFPIGGESFSFYNSPSTGGHPHDGLNVDSENRVWLDEEFANKLVEAIPSGSATPTPTGTPTLTSTPTLTPPPTSDAILVTDTFQHANQSL